MKRSAKTPRETLATQSYRKIIELAGIKFPLGSHVERINAGGCTGRRGRVCDVDGERRRVMWYQENTGDHMRMRTWVNLKTLDTIADTSPERI